MSRGKYTPEFKAKIVLEVLQGERELGAIAAENNLNPNMVRNWKAEFLENASLIFDHHGSIRHFAVLDTLAANVIQQKQAHLVARQQLILPRFVLNCNAHTVAIGVSRQQQIGIAPTGVFHAEGHRLLDFWVGIGTSREMTVRLLLLLDHGYVGIAHLLQNARDRL